MSDLYLRPQPVASTKNLVDQIRINIKNYYRPADGVVRKLSSRSKIAWNKLPPRVLHKLKVEKRLLHGQCFPMRLMQMSLEIQILGFYIIVKHCHQHDEVLTKNAS